MDKFSMIVSEQEASKWHQRAIRLTRRRIACCLAIYRSWSRSEDPYAKSLGRALAKELSADPLAPGQKDI